MRTFTHFDKPTEVAFPEGILALSLWKNGFPVVLNQDYQKEIHRTVIKD